MAVEIEIKAWVDDLEGLEKEVMKIADFIGAEEKEDIYYHFYPLGRVTYDKGDGVSEYEKPLAFRLRKSGEINTLTWKKKIVRENMEENIEREFTLSDYGTARDFIAYLGAWEYIRKSKRSRVYRRGDVQIELNHVVSLGDFIEIEKIVSESEPDKVEQARNEVRSLLEELGVPSEKIEKRFYTDLLQEVWNGNS